jgi:hypothetical protein
VAVDITGDELRVDLEDGRTLSVPVAWDPLHRAKRERTRWRLIGRGAGIHWPNLDEDIERPAGSHSFAPAAQRGRRANQMGRVGS